MDKTTRKLLARPEHHTKIACWYLFIIPIFLCAIVGFFTFGLLTSCVRVQNYVFFCTILFYYLTAWYLTINHYYIEELINRKTLLKVEGLTLIVMLGWYLFLLIITLSSPNKYQYNETLFDIANYIFIASLLSCGFLVAKWHQWRKSANKQKIRGFHIMVCLLVAFIVVTIGLIALLKYTGYINFIRY